MIRLAGEREGRTMALTGMLAVGLVVLAALSAQANAGPLIYNGSFEQVSETGRPAGWETAGRADIEQNLTVFDDPERGRVARLTCTHYVGGSPDAHVMLAQLGKVGVRRGRWYKFSLWARGEDLGGASVQVGLSNTRNWSATGLGGSFAPTPGWKRYEFFFRAKQDLAPRDSRLQIWFHGTGTLYVDDVAMEELKQFKKEWHPAYSLKDVPNALPNSGFECGGAGWGSWAPGISGWGAQLFRLHGEWDDAKAFEGSHSWKITLSPDEPGMLYFDYYEPLAERARAVLLGHRGWISVERGKPYVFSAYVAADRPGVPMRMAVWQADGRSIERTFTVGTDWQRLQLEFEAEKDYACGFVGPDLRESELEQCTVWVDAVQLEAGPAASDYRPRWPVESAVETDVIGNVFTAPREGLSFRLRAYNATDEPRELKGKLSIADFMDRTVWQSQPTIEVPPGQCACLEFDGILKGRTGFFWLRWEPEGARLLQELRCAVIESCEGLGSAFGMNHAFGREFLLHLAHKAGLSWWRDWSVKWQTVQPKPDGFDFSAPDVQINRVLAAGGKVEVLLPFPSALWASSADMAKVREEAGNNTYLLSRLPTAFMPKDLDAFARYVRESVRHYWPRVQVFEILNEPLFTTYALPGRFGYKAEDYVRLLRTAYQAAKQAAPDCVVMGGLAGPPGMHWWDSFIQAGGLKWCDIICYHMYPRADWAESHDEEFSARWEQIRREAGTKPIWMTEFGVYGDDRPPFTPQQVGDQAMTNALRPSELEAACDIVRFAAVMGAYGVRKVFYHAGTCGTLHRSSAGNMFFDYGGTPRKQYAAQAVLSRLLGPDMEFVRKWDRPEGVNAYEFRSRGQTVVIVWTRRSDAPAIELWDGVEALDLMGNPIPGRRVVPTDVPIYLIRR